MVIGLGLGVSLSAMATDFTATEALAIEGSALAQNKLAVMYYKGQEVSQDYTKAFDWFLKSATQGNSRHRLSF